MRSSFATAFIGLALFAASPSLAQRSQSSSATGGGGNCTTFNWDNQPGYLINGSTTRVSGAASCPGSNNATHACPIVVQGDAAFSWRNNISAAVFPPNQWSDAFLHDLILKAVNGSLGGQAWPEYAVAPVSTVQPLPQGTSGYVNFTVYERCFEGTMSNCTGGVQDGLPIRGCAPVVAALDRGSAEPNVLAGEYAVQEIPESDVGKYRDPFAGQSKGGASTMRGQPSTTVPVLLVMGMVGWWMAV